MEYKHLHPLTACLARTVAEVPGFLLFLAQVSQELLQPRERGPAWQETLFPRHSLSWSQQASFALAIVTQVPSSCVNTAREKPLLFLVDPWLNRSPEVKKDLPMTPLAQGGVYTHISNISRGFAYQMAAGFAKVSFPLATGLLLLPGWDFIWQRRKSWGV